MAVLKYIKKTKNPPEEILFRCIKSLVKFREATRKFINKIILKSVREKKFGLYKLTNKKKYPFFERKEKC